MAWKSTTETPLAIAFENSAAEVMALTILGVVVVNVRVVCLGKKTSLRATREATVTGSESE